MVFLTSVNLGRFIYIGYGYLWVNGIPITQIYNKYYHSSVIWWFYIKIKYL